MSTYMTAPAMPYDKHVQENVCTARAWLRLGLRVYVMHSDLPGCVRVLGKRSEGQTPSLGFDMDIPAAAIHDLIDIVGGWTPLGPTTKPIPDGGAPIVISYAARLDVFKESVWKRTGKGA